MNMRDKIWAKILRIVGIVLMGLTAAFTILGGAGTTCVALNPTGYGDKFAAIAPYQWLYILFVLVTLAIGILGAWAVVLLVKGTHNAYRNTLAVLIAGLVVGGIHMAVSRALRGGSMPVDMVVYVNLLTLIVFLLFRIAVIWQGVNFEKPSSNDRSGRNAAAIALAGSGLLTLVIQFLMAPTHTIGGFNYADAWHVSLTLLGVGLICAGVVVRKRGVDCNALPHPALPKMAKKNIWGRGR
jgi:hypothetical protein